MVVRVSFRDFIYEDVFVGLTLILILENALEPFRSFADFGCSLHRSYEIHWDLLELMSGQRVVLLPMQHLGALRLICTLSRDDPRLQSLINGWVRRIDYSLKQVRLLVKNALVFLLLLFHRREHFVQDLFHVPIVLKIFHILLF